MLANRLKELRKQNSITQEQLAAAIDVERSSVGKYESPSKPVQPSSDVLLRIASYFDVSTDYLLGNEKKEPTTVLGDGQAAKLADALRSIGIDVDRLSDADVKRIAKLAKAAFEE